MRARVVRLRAELREVRAASKEVRAASKERIGNLRSTHTALRERHDHARRYVPVYRQGLMADEFAKMEGVDLAADCYLALLPISVPAALQLKRTHGGMVVCDCVENVEVERQSIAPKISAPCLELVNLTAYGALLSSDKLMTVSRTLGDTLDRFGRPKLVLPNYRNYVEPVPNGTLRQRCGVPDHGVLLFASGNVVIGFEPVLEALARLPDHVHLAALVKLKPQDYDVAMRARIEELGLGGRVHLLPFVPYGELASTVADADIGLMTGDVANPNWAVSLPNRTFDYLAGGLPVVAPPIPDVAELLDRHGFGVHLAEVSGDAWAAALHEVIDNLDAYKAAARAARREICWERNEDALFDYLGRPERVTMIGFRDLSRNQRFQRIAATLTARGVKVKAVFLSTDPEPTTVEGAEFYAFNDRHGLGDGPRLVPRADADPTA
ncbi:MAG: glycosyltransferase [Paracoccaceae bacterium]